MATSASDERLSKYELLRPLGSGGMGEVYLARDRVLQRQVAIKFVSSKRFADPGADRRLVREARAAAALDHPAICPVYDVLGTDDRTCIVMQYVEGETLAARLKRGPLSPAEALALATSIADALTVAHAAGIIHRDLKPQNIILMPDGRPKLLDFGIAQTQLPPEVVASVVTHTATVTTQPGTVVGTPAYMSPEQVLRKPLDGRSDLFSLGAVFFECLTGQAAFQAATDVETWARVVYLTPPAPSSIIRAVTPALDAVVAKLLAKDPADRFASANETVAMLRTFAANAPLPRRWSARQVLIAAAAVVVATAVTATAAWRFTRPRPLPPAPPDAARWYQLGSEQLRDGAYSSAERAFGQALKLHADYPQALARLAEAQTALDEEREAAASVLRMDGIVPNPSRIAGVDGIRFLAVRALVEPDLPNAIQQYQRIANETQADRGAWLDLARVEQLAYRRTDALAAVERSLKIDPQYAAGHLWRALILSDLRRGDEALSEFSQAEALYRAASNSEGETATLFARANFLNGRGDSKQAQSVITGAARLAETSDNPIQQIRIAVLRSNISVRLGDFDNARQLAENAISMARRNRLDAVTASGLLELGTALQLSGDRAGAEARLKESIDLAERIDAKRIRVRSTLQLASLYVDGGQPRDAINLATGMLDYIRWAQYKQFELRALAILARANGNLNNHDEAVRLSNELLVAGDSVHDDVAVAQALEALVSEAKARGALPVALGSLARAEQINRDRQNNQSLAFDLWNHADILVREGRFDDAASPLNEIDAGIAAHIGAFVARGRQATVVRATSAAEREQFGEVEQYCDQILGPDASAKDPAAAMARVLRANAQARSGHPDRTPVDAPPPSDSDASRDLRYWAGIALLARADADGARIQADAILASLKSSPSSELEWRAAALGAAAARARRDSAAADAFALRARHALDGLRSEWKADADVYEKRPDLISLKRSAGMVGQ
jgi:tetratricopeptide (TPR) repeat protein/tRNA A-37 threonylcarbamoyl transferase component Bud32